MQQHQKWRIHRQHKSVSVTLYAYNAARLLRVTAALSAVEFTVRWITGEFQRNSVGELASPVTLPIDAKQTSNGKSPLRDDLRDRVGPPGWNGLMREPEYWH